MHNRRCIFGKPECEVTSLQHGHSVALSTHKQIKKNCAIQMTRTLLDLRLSGKILLTSDWLATKLLYTGHPYQTWYRHLISLIINNYGKRSLYKNVTIKPFFQRERRDKDRDSDMWHDRSRHSEIGFCRSPIPLVDGKRHPHTQSQFLCLCGVSFRWQISNPHTQSQFLCLQTTDFLQQVSIVLS